MDQNKNAQDQQDDASSEPNLDREEMRGGGSQERGSGSQGEKNSSGISNRGMSGSEEQADLPSRGSSGRDPGDEDSSDQSRQSER